MPTEHESNNTENDMANRVYRTPVPSPARWCPTRSLDEVLAVCRFLGDFPGPWWVGGGWAIDVWAGSPSREHEDVEICVLRSDQVTLKEYCAGWQSFTPVNDQWAAMAEGELLEFPRCMWQLRSMSGASRTEGCRRNSNLS